MKKATLALTIAAAFAAVVAAALFLTNFVTKPATIAKAERKKADKKTQDERGKLLAEAKINLGIVDDLRPAELWVKPSWEFLDLEKKTTLAKLAFFYLFDVDISDPPTNGETLSIMDNRNGKCVAIYSVNGLKFK